MQSVISKLSHGFTSKLFLLCTDILGLLLLFSLVYYLRLGQPLSIINGPIWVIVLITVITLFAFNVYRTEEPITRARLPLQTFLAVPIAGVFTTLFVYALGVSAFMPLFGRGVLPVAFLLFSFWAAGWRWLLTFANQRYRTPIQWLVLVGSELSVDIQKDIEQRDVDFIEVVDINQQNLHLPSLLQASVNSDASQCETRIIIASQHTLSDDIARAIMKLRFEGIKVLSLSDFYETYWSRVPVLHLKDNWFAQTGGFSRIHDRVGLRLQRVTDIAFSSFGLLVLSPVLLLFALLIKFSSKGNALYSQTRVGLYGKPFTLYKLRTMVQDAEKDGPKWATEHDPRITPLGRFLRSSRLDEVPQLWNVLKGEMSLIGPRPERPRFVENLKADIPYYDLRHLVPPGITGWAQVMYPYGASVEDARKKLEYDLYYIKNHSLQLEFAIFVKTALLMLRQGGR